MPPEPLLWDNIGKTTTKLYDAIVVGSGASGGWVAKILTEHGMEVLLLEAGPPRSPTRDFTEHVWPYRMRYRGFGNQKALLGISPYSGSVTPATNTATSSSSTTANFPTPFPQDKPFMWIRGRQVGGKTFCWARVSYRYSDYEFQAAAATATARTGPSATKTSSPITTR